MSRTRGRAPPYPRVSAIDTYGVCASPKGPWTRRAGGGILSNHANRSTNTALGSAADGCDVRPRLAPWIALRARRSRPEAAVRKLSPGEEANGREPRTDGGAGAVTAASWSRRSRRGLTQEGRRREPAPRRMAVNNRVRSPATILSPYTGASPAPPVPARASAPASRRPSSTRILTLIFVALAIVIFVPVVLIDRNSEVLAGLASLVLFAVATAAFVAYAALEGGRRGQTIGKRLMGIRVIDYGTGAPIGIGRAILRGIIRQLGGIPLYLGWLWMLWDPERQGWHDKVANDLVVPISAYPISAVQR